MGLITVVGFRHDLIHELCENACNAGVAIYEALQSNNVDYREGVLKHRGVSPSMLLFTPTIHTGDEHWFRASGNTLREVKRGARTYRIGWRCKGDKTWQRYGFPKDFETQEFDVAENALRMVRDTNKGTEEFCLLIEEAVLEG